MYLFCYREKDMNAKLCVQMDIKKTRLLTVKVCFNNLIIPGFVIPIKDYFYVILAFKV